MIRPLNRAGATVPTPVGIPTIDRLRRRGIQAWAVGGWVCVILMLIANAMMQAGLALPILIAGGAFNLAPTAMALKGRHDVQARMLTGTLAAALPAMLVFLLQGQGWQMDAHMYFFVGMGALVTLGDWRPIAVAALLIAAHHLLLQWVAPAWVFSGGGNVGRVMFHATAVALQFATLASLTTRLRRLFDAQDEAIRQSHRLVETAHAERERALNAMEQARAAEAVAATERRARAEAIARTAAERRGEFLTLANEFERSVTSVVRGIGTATEQLQTTALRLDSITADTNHTVEEVSAGASRAAVEISQVASSIRDLSQSIRTIAVAAAHQSELTGVATDRAERSVRTIETLEERAARIAQLVDDIRKLAAKTDMLALNATIEAARAGASGQGFAIVAAEVKGLAAETTRASDAISALLLGIRENIAATGAELRHVNGAIGEVAGAATGIASAVIEQRQTTLSVDALADRAVDSAVTIERRIGMVASAAGSAAALCVELRDSASNLATSARDLRTSTDLFVSFLHDADEERRAA